MKKFDPKEKNKWFYGSLKKDQTDALFQSAKEDGVFLIRQSATFETDYVLCVKEADMVKHYRIQSAEDYQSRTGVSYEINKMKFSDLSHIIEFYSEHYLEGDFHLVQPVQPEALETVSVKYEMPDRESQENVLQYKTGEVLDVLLKVDKYWLLVRNQKNQVGRILAHCVTKCEKGNRVEEKTCPSDVKNENRGKSNKLQSSEMKFPFKAVALKERVPNQYMENQLTLHTGDVVTVISTRPDGQWLGTVDNRKGLFPYTYVEILTEEDQ